MPAQDDDSGRSQRTSALPKVALIGAKGGQWVLQLLRDPNVSIAIGNLGRSEVEKQFSTERMRVSLMRAYHAALSQPCAKITKQTVGV